MRTNGTRVLEYDDENQLTRVTEPGAWKAEFIYDGKFRMRVSKDFTWRNGAWVLTNEVRRAYDGMLVLQERDQFNVPRITYTRGRDLSGSLEGAGGIGGLVALSEMSNLSSPIHSYYHADGNGNITAMVDTNQNVVARYLYDPFGNTLLATGPKAAVNRYRFSSKELHAASGMYYYTYRWYIPELQRWGNRDPIQEFGGKNLFQFCYNNPINKRDRWGLDSCGDELKDCLNNAEEKKNWNVCQLGGARNNQKDATKTAEDFWGEYCDKLGSPTSPEVIGCKQAVAGVTGTYGGAVDMAYWALLAGIYAGYNAERGVCYSSYLYCQANKIGVF